MSEMQNVQKIVPFEGSKLSKKEQIATMFDNIAHRYDFLNHFMSMGIDIIWRKKALNYLRSMDPSHANQYDKLSKN